MSKIDCNDMIFAYTACKKDMGPISWMCVSIVYVIISAKFHGHMNYVAMGSLGRRRIGRNLAYEGSASWVAQMTLASKEEM